MIITTIKASCTASWEPSKNQTHEYRLIPSAQVRDSIAKMVIKSLLKNI